MPSQYLNVRMSPELLKAETRRRHLKTSAKDKQAALP
jgi:hypothetical protein